MYGARVITHMAELARVWIAGDVGVEDGIHRPDSNMAIYSTESVKLHIARKHLLPPAAVASLLPSGDTWQLYTSKSFCSPRC